MKLFTLLLFFIPTILFAQVNGHEEPSFLKEIELADGELISLTPPQTNDLLKMQQSAKTNGTLVPMGKIIPISIPKKWATTEIIEGHIIRETYNLECKKAKGLTVYLSEVFMPFGAKLFVSNTDGSQIYGPYTFDDVINEKLTPGMIDGDFIRLVIEYEQNSELKPQFTISELGYNVGDLTVENFHYGSRDFGDSEKCQVNANCDEGENWRDQQKAVVRIKLRIQNYEGWCTGTIMNNTQQDCTPYVLTADHCRQVEDKEALPENYDDWQFYLNYEGDKCSNPRKNQVGIAELTGCKKIANSGRMGTGGPDHLLVKLSGFIDGSIYPHYYAGWRNTNIGSARGVMIHHPSGDIKKISTYKAAATSSEWDPNVKKGTHWQVYWAETDNGYGVSEPGSSGSALWDANGLVMGVLTGGASACTEDQDKGVSPNFPDYFGKFSLAFGYEGSDTTRTLFNYLDGSNHASEIEGIAWPCNELPLSKELEKIAENELKIFPNPANTLVSITFENLNVERLTVFNFQGEEIAVQQNFLGSETSLNVEDWPIGFYLVQVKSSNGILLNKKLVIE